MEDLIGFIELPMSQATHLAKRKEVLGAGEEEKAFKSREEVGEKNEIFGEECIVWGKVTFLGE